MGIVKYKLNITINPSEFKAIHRTPWQIDEARPAHVKLINCDVTNRFGKVRGTWPKKDCKTGRWCNSTHYETY